MLFIAEAHAQTAEAAKAAAQAADVLFQYKVLGAACVLLLLALGVAGFVIKSLYGDVKACNAVSLDDRRELIKAVEAAKDGAERSEDAFKSLQQTLETRGQAVAELSRQFEINAEKMTHGFGNLGQTLESFVRLIERERDRADRADRGRP